MAPGGNSALVVQAQFGGEKVEVREPATEPWTISSALTVHAAAWLDATNAVVLTSEQPDIGTTFIVADVATRTTRHVTAQDSWSVSKIVGLTSSRAVVAATPRSVGGPSVLYELDLVTGNTRPLTNDRQSAYWPVAMAAGGQVAFVDESSNSRCKIGLVDVIQPLVDRCLLAALSPDLIPTDLMVVTADDELYFTAPSAEGTRDRMDLWRVGLSIDGAGSAAATRVVEVGATTSMLPSGLLATVNFVEGQDPQIDVRQIDSG